MSRGETQSLREIGFALLAKKGASEGVAETIQGVHLRQIGSICLGNTSRLLGNFLEFHEDFSEGRRLGIGG